MPEQQGCLGFIFKLFGSQSEPPNLGELPHVQVNKYFVTNAEADLFRVLRSVVGDSGHILAQVSMGQLLWFPGNRQSNPGRQGWKNRVTAKSVDFVVCDPSTLRPFVAIELDEPSHDRPDRQWRDEQVEAILRAAGLPLVRFRTARAYDTRIVFSQIAPYLPQGRDNRGN
jgi:hypothetical protein